MKLFEEILDSLQIERELIHNKTKFILYGKKLAYFENVKKIFAFTPTELIVWTKDGKVQVSGTNLTIGQYGDGDLVLQGSIDSVVFLQEN